MTHYLFYRAYPYLPISGFLPLIYKNTENLRSIQLLSARAKLEGTIRHRGVEIEDMLEIAE